MEKIKGYINTEQLAEIIKVIAPEVANDHYCAKLCPYRQNEKKCGEQTEKGRCTMGDERAHTLYAEYLMILYDANMEYKLK